MASLQNNAAYVEGSDAAANNSTIYTIGVGDAFSGTLNPVGDNDWVAITLTAGTSTLISLSNTAGSPDLDTYLELYNSSGALVATNDDAGASYNSQLEFAAIATDTYYINARSYDNASSGAYQITTSDNGGTLPVYTYDQIAAYLESGYWGKAAAVRMLLLWGRQQYQREYHGPYRSGSKSCDTGTRGLDKCNRH